jgi:hypothetical protein
MFKAIQHKMSYLTFNWDTEIYATNETFYGGVSKF